MSYSLINIVANMKTVIQRALKASVEVNNSIVGSINNGLLVLVGFHSNDTIETVEWVCQKILKMRIFHDLDQKMNLSVLDVGGEILVVSQFTLYGDANKGNRPSFIDSARPDEALPLYEYMINYLKTKSSLNIQTGEFGSMMHVSLVNNGPVTILLEK